MKIAFAQFEQADEGFDVSTNPEIALMIAQGDVAESEAEESVWHSASAITRPQPINY